MADACHKLLDYVATHPNAGICYKACNMVLLVHTEASYLSEQGGKSRAAGNFYLSNCNDEDFNNGWLGGLQVFSHPKIEVSKGSRSSLGGAQFGT